MPARVLLLHPERPSGRACSPQGAVRMPEGLPSAALGVEAVPAGTSYSWY